MSFKLDWMNSQLGKNLQVTKEKSMVALKMYAATKAPEITSYMKQNRPWTDRTGMAKMTLRTTVSENPSEHKVRITLAHGVTYGIWLELANDQNYAIIIPTLERYSEVIHKDLGEIFKNIMVKL